LGYFNSLGSRVKNDANGRVKLNPGIAMANAELNKKKKKEEEALFTCKLELYLRKKVKCYI
jgi:hypothetical protein